MYKISVIIPVFNAEKTLSGAFNSMLNQTFDFEDIEVIFVDDCSTDNSRNIIMDFVNQYDNVKLICNEQNSGYAGKPRNVGILNATADYLMFLDPDDEFYEDAFEFLYNKISDNNQIFKRN
jgi:glycosyltransferase involved in cell wall biosynthesis